jgi:DNA invertase Pin-like site-specific DNA recombinase
MTDRRTRTLSVVPEPKTRKRAGSIARATGVAPLEAPPDCWVGYLRVSDRRQAEDGEGLASQKASILRWAEETGNRITRWQEDQAPGTVDFLSERQGLAVAMGWIKSKYVAGIAVSRLDRLARDLATQEFLLRELVQIGGRCASALPEEDRVLDGLDLDPTRTMIRQIFGAFAQYERAMLKIRLTSGRMKRRAEDKWNGGTIPYGFVVDDEERLQPDPFEAPLIAQGLTLRRMGVSLADIGEYWSVSGIRLKRAKSWTPQAVKQVLATAVRRGLTPGVLQGVALEFQPQDVVQLRR